MKLKKFSMILLIILMILVSASYAADGDYKIPSVIKDITVNEDGSTIITEEITYDIEGSVNGVYRDIPLSANQTLRNISVKTPGYYNKLEVIEYDNITKLRVWLYTDAAKTQKTNDAKVSVTYKYTIDKGLKVYNDIAELQYMTWGDEWNSKVNHLESNIHVPCSKNDVEYWNNPEDNVVSSQWTNDNTLTTKLDNIDAHNLFEQRLIMPKSNFKHAIHAQQVNMDGKDLIEQDEKKYHEERNIRGTINTIAWTILGLLVLLPFGIYTLFGREPKIDYNAEYEYDLPTDDTLIQINSLMDGEVGSITYNALYATILDLIDRKYFKIVVNDKDNTIIRQTDKDTSNLKKHEKSIITFLSSFAEDGNISIGYVGRKSHRQQYQSFIAEWHKQAKEETPQTWIKEYFDDKGSTLLLYTAGIFFLGFIIVMIPMVFHWVPDYLTAVTAVAMFIFMFGFVALLTVPNSIPGRWTLKGKEFHDKWENFEKYIKDYSLIKERPPASVQVWGRYIIYASALGCADKVTKNMKEYFKSMNIVDDSFDNDTVASFTYYNGFAHIESSFDTLSRSESSDSGSGVGSSGSGGFGGGGGGTF